MSKINPDCTLHIQRCCVYFAKKSLHFCSEHFTKTPLTQHHWMWRMWSGLILLMGAAGPLAHRIRSPAVGNIYFWNVLETKLNFMLCSLHVKFRGLRSANRTEAQPELRVVRAHHGDADTMPVAVARRSRPSGRRRRRWAAAPPSLPPTSSPLLRLLVLSCLLVRLRCCSGLAVDSPIVAIGSCRHGYRSATRRVPTLVEVVYALFDPL
jgi:hypothetical protein